MLSSYIFPRLIFYLTRSVSSSNSFSASYARIFGLILNHRNVENETEKVQAFAEEKKIPIVGEIPRSDEIIRWEDQGKTVIEGDADSEISKRFFELAEKLLEDETITTFSAYPSRIGAANPPQTTSPSTSYRTTSGNELYERRG